MALLKSAVRNGPLQLLPGQTGRQRRLQDVLAALLLQLDLLAPPPNYVDECKLGHRQENENRYAQEPNLARFDVGHLRQSLALSGSQSDEGQHGGGAQGRSRGRGVCLQPERHPRSTHKHN